MNNKVENNQSDPELCSFILLKFGYDSQFILPVEDALSMIRSLAMSRRYSDNSGHSRRVSHKIDDITVGFLSQMDINKMAVEDGLTK
jgi:hypothetical protein